MGDGPFLPRHGGGAWRVAAAASQGTLIAPGPFLGDYDADVTDDAWPRLAMQQDPTAADVAAFEVWMRERYGQA